MEVTGENLTLLHTIRPPNLEDTGLEDCALPPDSIKEAFLKAASVVGSRAASVFAGDEDEIDGGCVNDPWMKKSAPSDALVGVVPESDPPRPCAAVKGGNGEPAGDVVIVGEKNKEEFEDEVVIVGGKGGGEGGDCVDGLKGLEIKEKDEEKDDEEQDEKKTTLVEGFLNP